MNAILLPSCVEAAAVAIFQNQTGMDWESRSDVLKAHFLDDARAALEAAAPFMQSKPAYRFKIRATGLDPTGYYYVNWDKAQSLSVLAGDKTEATKKALEMLGTHPRFGSWRKPGSGWTFKWDAMDEEQVTP